MKRQFKFFVIALITIACLAACEDPKPPKGNQEVVDHKELTDSSNEDIAPLPVIGILSSTSTSEVHLTITGSPGSKLEIFADEESIGTFTMPENGTFSHLLSSKGLSEGRHIITADLTDPAGKGSTSLDPVEFIIGSQAIKLTFEHPRAYQDGDVSSWVLINIDIDNTLHVPSDILDGDTFELKLDGKSIDTSKFGLAPNGFSDGIDNISRGLHILTAKICNRAGKCSAHSSRVFRVGEPVKITSIKPNQAKVGDTVTIYGSGFDTSDQGENIILLSGVRWWYPYKVISSSEMMMKIPEGSISGDVRIGVEPYMSNSYEITIIPTIKALHPQILSRGDTIRLEGTGFGGIKENIDVRLCTNTDCTTYHGVEPSWVASTVMNVPILVGPEKGISGPIFVAVNNVVSENAIPILIAEPPDEIPEDPFNETTVMKIGQTAIGSISHGEKDLYTFEGVAGTSVTIKMWSVDKYDQPIPKGGTPDTKIRLLDPNGKVIGSDDDEGWRNKNSLLEIDLPTNGTYTIEASANEDDSGFYHLQIK